MRIGIDVSLVPGQPSGGSQYAHQLTRALATIDAVNSYLLYPVFYYIVHPNFARADLPTTPNMRIAHRWMPSQVVRFLWRQHRSDRFKEFLLGNVDLVHSTTFCAPRFRRGRKRLIVTIYDLSFITYPEFHLAANVEHCLRGTKLAIDRADAIIAISESTRRQLIGELGVPAERIVVTPLASGRGLERVSDPVRLAAVRHRYNLPERFVLFLGALEPRKNVLRLLEAFAALSPALRREYELVVAGTQGWLNESVRDHVRKYALGQRVRFAGHIDQHDVAALYSLATVFAYPSIWEGFGLPVLEAMACGTPVLTSSVSSLPEVAGDAAILAPPTDVAALTEGLRRLLEDAALRADLEQRGRRRAALFSWERCARETLAVYQAVAG